MISIGRPSTRRRCAAGALALALACAAPVPATMAGPPEPTTVEAEQVLQRPAEVREYWTPRRQRLAAPPPAALRAGPPPSGESAPRRPDRAARRADPARIGAARAAVQTSAANTAFPARVHGKVLFTIRGGSSPGNFVCSATAVSSNAHTLVLTAGHCVHDPEFGGGFATNWTFVPGLRNGERPFGNWPATELFTTREWREDGSIRLDLGAATLARDSQGRGIEDVLGARGIAFSQPRAQRFEAFGYPAVSNPLATPPRFDFDGQSLWSCSSAVTGGDAPPGLGPLTMQIGCDMTGGSSGGAWVTEGGLVNGLTSYGYSNDGNHLYGPYLGAGAEALYREAAGAPILCVGREVTNLGSATADRFEGGGGRDVFKLRAGGDRAVGGGDRDVACGGVGGDRLDGGPGDDRLRGGAGRDLLFGGPGDDLCVGGPGRDRATGCERERRIP